MPGIAAIGFVLALSVTLLFGQLAQSQLTQIERGYAPSLAASQALVDALGSLQRALRDAVAVSDTSQVTAADSIATRFETELAKLSGNPVVDPRDHKNIGDAFQAYYALTAKASTGMINGTLGDDATAQLMAMSVGFRGLRDSLDARAGRDRERIDNAFSEARWAQQKSSISSVIVLVAALAALWFLAVGTLRSVLGPLKEIAHAADAIARGRLDQRIEYQSADEVGAVATSFRGMLEYVSGIAEAADRLAKGDMSATVEPRSEQDVLSRNMNRATETLSSMMSETNELIVAARNGDLAHRGNPEKFEGVYAELLQRTNEMLDALAEPLQEARQVLERVAARDLSARMSGNYKGDHDDIKQSLNSALGTIGSTFEQLQNAINEISHAATDIGQGSNELANSASEQARSVEQVTTHISMVGERTRRNVSDASNAMQNVEGARKNTQSGVQHMQDLAAAVSEIRNSTAQTAKIVKTIDDIAFQTNLLALNASVEAARAGDAGRGFAVVASEVRELALKAAGAARSTSELIEASVRSAETGVTLNERVQKVLGEINSSVQQATQDMTQIADGAKAQERELTDITKSLDRIGELTQRTAATAEESASASTELSSQAREMNKLAAQFKTGSQQPARGKTIGLKRPEPTRERFHPLSIAS
ncbi:MAG: methyl-accepting chemotaxis protein [Phycisphaerae bacterium]|nr:methyl-accepting chemotaxis protein [Gemmatimonadaceae bacterium]